MHVDQSHRLSPARAACHVLSVISLIVALPLIVSIGVGSLVLAQAPGLELFAKEPNTPMELWEAVDYLLRTDQAKKAVPYIDRFLKSKPDESTLIAIRNRYGPRSILRLSDDVATRSLRFPWPRQWRLPPVNMQRGPSVSPNSLPN